MYEFQNTEIDLFTDFSAKLLVNLYRAAIVQVFNRYFEEFQQITEKMIDEGIADKKEIDAFSSEVCVPIVGNISKQVIQHLSELRVSQLIKYKS